MPELPEVETIVRGLDPLVRRRRIEAVWWSGQGLHLGRKVDLRGLRAVAVGRAIVGVRRRGKYILIDVDGDPDRQGRNSGAGIIIHLGMTGRLRVQPKSAPRVPHTHVVLAFAGGDELRFVDARRFGWVTPGRPIAADAALAALGPDPLTELDAPALAAALGGARTPIKAFLLDQRRIAGVGNIYADEALFRAGVHPLRPAGRLTAAKWADLRDAIEEALAEGIEAKGASIDDFRHIDGARGSFQDRFLIHRRAGEPCVRCGGTVKKIVVGGRGTYVCERCQPRPRQRRAVARVPAPSRAMTGADGG